MDPSLFADRKKRKQARKANRRAANRSLVELRSAHSTSLHAESSGANSSLPFDSLQAPFTPPWRDPSLTGSWFTIRSPSQDAGRELASALRGMALTPSNPAADRRTASDMGALSSSYSHKSE
jgi:hypothetical protein